MKSLKAARVARSQITWHNRKLHTNEGQRGPGSQGTGCTWGPGT